MVFEITLLSVTLIAFVAAFFVLRARHRYLFAKIQELNTRLVRLQENQLQPLRDDVRILHRLRLIDRRFPESSGNVQTAVNPFTSQSREDILIFDFFANKKPGYFIEAGAYDGVAYSNTFLLERMGWKGLLVEAIPRKAEQCRRNRPQSRVVQAALGGKDASGEVEFTFAEDPRGGGMLSFVEADERHLKRCIEEQCSLQKVKVPIRTLDALLEGQTNSVDFLSLDIEGTELDALTGFDIARFRPKLVLMEQQNGPGDNAIRDYLSTFGFVRCGVKGSNYFFVAREHQAEFESLLCDDEKIAAG
jgi:FkbM family methyltransferase